MPHSMGLRLCAGFLGDGFKAALLCLPAQAPPLQDPGMCALGQTIPESSVLQPLRLPLSKGTEVYLFCEEVALVSTPALLL